MENITFFLPFIAQKKPEKKPNTCIFMYMIFTLKFSSCFFFVGKGGGSQFVVLDNLINITDLSLGEINN
jgi:hypothetical protein